MTFFIETSSYGWVNVAFITRVYIDNLNESSGSNKRGLIYGLFVEVGSSKYAIKYYARKRVSEQALKTLLKKISSPTNHLIRM